MHLIDLYIDYTDDILSVNFTLTEPLKGLTKEPGKVY